MKKYCILLLLQSVLSGLCTGQVPVEGLTGYYPFNGNTNDESGNENHLLNNGATLVTDKNGLPDQAYFFDYNANISAPDSTTYSDLDSSFSISLSYIANSLQCYWPTLVNKLHATGTSFTGFYLGIVSSRNILRFRVGNSYIETPSVLDQWQHVVISFGNDSIKLFVNGELKGKKFLYDKNIGLEANFMIGKQSQADIKQLNWFTGKIDEIRVYNRLLNQSEVELLYYDFSTNLVAANKMNSIQVYPNPARNHITIRLSDFPLPDAAIVKIINPAGQAVYTSTLSKQCSSFDFSVNNPKGIYFVMITDAKSRILAARKIVLQ